MSYREIGQKLDLTRPAVESALFRARRRLESEYTELSEGRRCEAMRDTIARMAAGTQRGAEEHRLARHAKRCPSCLRQAREQGVEPLTTLGALRQKAAALLPLPWLFRRSGDDGGGIVGLFSTGASAAPLAERGAVALVAAAALVGAGGVALEGGALPGDRATAGEDRPAVERSAPVRGESQRGTAGPAADGERAGARRASERRGSGPAGGRAGDSTGSTETLKSEGPNAPAGGSGPAVGPLPANGSLPAGPGDPTKALPSLPEAQPPSAPAPPANEIELGVPGLPRVAPELPPVQAPDAPLPGVQSVTGQLEGATDQLQGVLR
jgi:hypothetical protein